MALILTVLLVFVLLVGCEFWWRRQKPNDEFSRKFIHLTVGSFVAFWPFFLTWHQIYWLSLAFVVVVGLSRQFGVFNAIHSVQRPTLGEFFFAGAVIATALITHNKWVYAAALLQMSLADGMAAIVGTRWGGSYKYSVLGHTKSLAGTLTFWIVSTAILIVLNGHLPQSLDPVLLVALGLGGALLENVSVLGVDNLVIPVVFALALSHL